VRYRAGDGEAAICAFQRGKGRITLVNDARLLANDHLALADNLDLLEELFPAGATVRFDEYHQGAAVASEAEHAGRLEAALAQGAVLYLLVAWQRSRPLGPPRRGLAEREPGLRGELRTLGALHAANDHGVVAAIRLLAMARRRYAGDPRLARLPEEIRDTSDALALGRALAEMERRTA
jgi:hypothetical protein